MLLIYKRTQKLMLCKPAHLGCRTFCIVIKALYFKTTDIALFFFKLKKVNEENYFR